MSKSLKFERLNSPVTTSSSSSIPLVKKSSEVRYQRWRWGLVDTQPFL
jgi:hypothetical protein